MEFLARLAFMFASIFVSAVPERYRRTWPVKDGDLRGPAIVSGILEFLFSAPGSIFYFATAISVAKGGFGVAGLVLNPYLLFPFMMAEGAVRFLAAFTGEQILPTAPLGLIAWIHNAMDGKAAAIALGQPIPDTIQRGAGQAWDVRVLSCRAKPHWNSYMSIRFEGEFYQMFNEETGPAPRTWVYLLRKNPPGRAVVIVYDYGAEDANNPLAPPRRWMPGDP